MTTHFSTLHSRLTIRDLELNVNLGWPEKERLQEQRVLLDIEIRFLQPLKACMTDNLQDTICYATLTQTLRNEISGKKFSLIEHLAHTLYQILKSQLPEQTHLNVRLTKYPNIEGLLSGVSFDYGDNSPTWSF